MTRNPVRLAVSMGDPAGVGPEVILGAVTGLSREIEVTIFGDRRVIGAAAEAMSSAGRKGPVPDREVDLIPVSVLADSEICFGKPSGIAGEASYRYVIAALRAVMAGDADALVTAPISKQWWMEAGHNYPGHTELLAEQTGTKNYAMMLAGPSLRVVPVTTHIPLDRVSKSLSTEKVLGTIRLVNKTLIEWFDIKKPRLACTALNPHAGEGGYLGKEEIEIILPAVESAKGEGTQVTGPIPADSLFARRDDYDAVICMYHDQALIPIKTLHLLDAVNLTLGLPIVRTSPDHGTAYDIAGKGVAKPDSMLAAMEMAAMIAEKILDKKTGKKTTRGNN